MSALITPEAGGSADAAERTDALVPMLQSAARGERRLDLMIGMALGRIAVDSSTVLHLLLDTASEIDDAAGLIGGDCPRYTTALDAALPWENIILALYQPQRQAWAAVHRGEAGDIVGTGATEALARRVAALKARLPAADSHRPRPAATAKAPRPSAPPPGPADKADAPEPGRGRSGCSADETDGSGDWEILW